MQNVIIQGSSNSFGNTRKISEYIIQSGNWDLIDLNDYDFGYFDYAYNNEDDDFLSLIKKVINEYNIILFATPVYWYNMSGIMKVFFDRISDLLKHHKERGRELKDRKMAALSCSGGENTHPAFFYPFKATADYLDMKYLGDHHVELTDQKLSLTLMNSIDKFVRTLET